jgi:hypothetical protein
MSRKYVGFGDLKKIEAEVSERRRRAEEEQGTPVDSTRDVKSTPIIEKKKETHESAPVAAAPALDRFLIRKVAARLKEAHHNDPEYTYDRCCHGAREQSEGGGCLLRRLPTRQRPPRTAWRFQPLPR